MAIYGVSKYTYIFKDTQTRLSIWGQKHFYSRKLSAIISSIASRPFLSFICLFRSGLHFQGSSRDLLLFTNSLFDYIQSKVYPTYNLFQLLFLFSGFLIIFISYLPDFISFKTCAYFIILLSFLVDVIYIFFSWKSLFFKMLPEVNSCTNYFVGSSSNPFSSYILEFVCKPFWTGSSFCLCIIPFSSSLLSTSLLIPPVLEQVF